MKSDRKAKSVISLSFFDDYLEHVRDVTTAKDMWDTISIVFERHTMYTKLSVRIDVHTV